jgi:RimJ/RimL family protein N-acetyltransferase
MTRAASPLVTVTTERLSLRPPVLEDFTIIGLLWSDPAVIRHIGGSPSSKQELWEKLLRSAGNWALLGYGPFLVRERSSGRFMGEVGYFDRHRDIEPSYDNVPEIGWALMPWAHGQGFAGEAVRAVQAWFEAAFGAQRTVCLIDPDNAPSLRLADRCGFREIARTRYKGRPAIILER